MKKILIVGKNSYIGNMFINYAEENNLEFIVKKISSRNNEWEKEDFSRYDCILNVAGIAHADISRVTEEEKNKYFEINSELPYRIAKKAKSEGVKQFIYLSSSIIYGDSSFLTNEKLIDRNTVPSPENFYGESKLRGEENVLKLVDDKFKVSVLRLPMVYGYKSKGNFPKLWKLSGISPIFPKISNKRSMLYIKNLCEFIKYVIENEKKGIFYPQNKEILSTSEIVKTISVINDKKMYQTKILNILVYCLYLIPIEKTKNLIKKSFGSLYYKKEISDYEGNNYQLYSFEESIVDMKNELENH